MSQTPKDTRTAAEKVRDTAAIIGSLKHEGYVLEGSRSGGEGGGYGTLERRD